MKKVCCILVTFNRKKCLEKVLGCLKNQTYKIDGMIIVNNASTDNTVSFLVDKGYVEEISKIDELTKTTKDKMNVYFYNSSMNTGGAGGFKKAFEIAMEIKDEYDCFWVMDDDIAPRENCLEIMMKSFEKGNKIIVARRIGENFDDPIITKYSFYNPFVHLLCKRLSQPKNKNKSEYYVKTFAFEGPMFSKEIIEKVGVPNQNYFLQGDDYDYAFRCLKYSKIVYLNDAIIDRQLPNITKSSSQEKTYWRLYYSIRNMALLDLRYVKCKLFARIRVNNLKIRWWLISKKHKDVQEWKIAKKAIRDAIHQRDGKIIEPGSI